MLKEAALQMFASVPGVFGNQQNNYLDLIKQMLQHSLMQTESYEVRFQAVRAIGAFILVHEKETQILKHFDDLLPGLLQVTAESIQQQEDDTLLKVLIELAETTPKFLRPQLVPIYDMCMKIFSDASALDSWRQLALEVNDSSYLFVVRIISTTVGIGYGDFGGNGTSDGPKTRLQIHATTSATHPAIHGRLGRSRWMGRSR